MRELQHTTLLRIDLSSKRFLPDWYPPRMAGSFLRNPVQIRAGVQPVYGNTHHNGALTRRVAFSADCAACTATVGPPQDR